MVSSGRIGAGAINSERFAGIAEKPHRTPLFAVSVLIAFVGVAAFGTVLFRLS